MLHFPHCPRSLTPDARSGRGADLQNLGRSVGLDRIQVPFVVQWIGHFLAEEKMQVRFLPRGPRRESGATMYQYRATARYWYTRVQGTVTSAVENFMHLSGPTGPDRCMCAMLFIIQYSAFNIRVFHIWWKADSVTYEIPPPC